MDARSCWPRNTSFVWLRSRTCAMLRRWALSHRGARRRWYTKNRNTLRFKMAPSLQLNQQCLVFLLLFWFSLFHQMTFCVPAVHSLCCLIWPPTFASDIRSRNTPDCTGCVSITTFVYFIVIYCLVFAVFLSFPLSFFQCAFMFPRQKSSSILAAS